jgi:KUP system potassium uptake protein
MFAVVFLVIVFRSSSNLAAAYGIAVTGTIVITTLLASTVLVRRLGWTPAAAGLFLLAFLSVNGMFFLSNLPKVTHGGWLPLLFGGLMFYVMHTWVRGRQVASDHHAKFSPALDEFLTHLPRQAVRIPRTAIYLTSSLNYVPPALMYNLAHNNVLHQQVILLKVARARIPRYPEGERIRVTFLSHGFSAITTTYGFMEQPDIPGILARCAEDYGLMLEFPQATSYFLSHHTYIPNNGRDGLNRWQEPIFVFLESVTQSAISYFRIPNNQVVEIGAQVEI